MPTPFITPNMGLTEPTVGGTISPSWAMYLNTDLSIIDQHNHTPGFGVPITPAGLDINTALDFKNQNAINLNAIIFAGAISGSPVPLEVYSDGTDLWFEDINGNPIQLTKAGSPNAGTGNIQGLPSTPTGGAGISWVNSSSTFQFFLDSGSVGAALEAGTYILRYPGSYPTPSGNAVLLQAPSSISGLVPVTFPAALPGAISTVTMATSGQLGYALNPSVSSSSGNGFGTSSTSFVPVTNLTRTVTTTGRPVKVEFIPDGTTNPAIISVSTGSTNGQASAVFQIDRDGTTVWQSTLDFTILSSSLNFFIQTPPGSLNITDTSASAGSHTYTLSVKNISSGQTLEVRNIKMVVYEV